MYGGKSVDTLNGGDAKYTKLGDDNYLAMILVQLKQNKPFKSYKSYIGDIIVDTLFKEQIVLKGCDKSSKLHSPYECA